MPEKARYRLADFGSFFIPGRTVVRQGQPPVKLRLSEQLEVEQDTNGSFAIEQTYVQYYVPAEPTGSLPIVLVHGGGLTGALWETTPDGRPGWLHRLLERGRTVYVVDMAERGRSGWCCVPGEWDSPAVMRSAEYAWWFFRIGLEQDYAARKAAPGQRFPVAAFDTFVQQGVPRWVITTRAKVAGLTGLLDRIGPACLFGFSEGAEMVQRAAAARPGLAPVAVMLEGVTYPDELAASPVAGRRFLYVTGDAMHLVSVFAESMPRIDARVAELKRAGADATHLSLPAAGIAGNTHMMMHDENSDEVLAAVMAWLDRG